MTVEIYTYLRCLKYFKYYIVYLNSILELMSCMLSLDPNKRCRCSEALKMPYFRNRPAPTPGPNLPMPNSLSSKDSDLNDFEVATGNKRKLLESSGLAKKLVF